MSFAFCLPDSDFVAQLKAEKRILWDQEKSDSLEALWWKIILVFLQKSTESTTVELLFQ
jgi:hypothetical protein